MKHFSERNGSLRAEWSQKKSSAPSYSKFADRAVNFDVAIERLRFAFTRPLPGAVAQAFMAPEPRRDWPKGFNQDKIRSAAGLLLLFPIDGEAHIVLTLRSDALGRHGGQVSLP